jgi:antitoxin component YwqK of YwqJK toxin-antitoxin module
MEHQEQLLNKWLIGYCLILFACNSSNNQQNKVERFENAASSPVLLVNQLDSTIRNLNGVIYKGSQPFTGIMFALYPSTSDTSLQHQYLNGLENGEWIKWYPKHQLRESRFFKSGKKEGVYTIYWENGKKQLEYHFLNDEYEGICREWNAEGRLTKEMNYVKGHEEGSQKWWYDNGKIKANYVIINGRRFGLLGTKNCMNVSDSIFKK